ncbi:conserved hypothetical protein [Perkinsus marinus ATCC 50983]|uniref:Non-haem dioxygenase N-terminal domain-containing protein n=1 Tax=Perkinsus marinus (strain ATCC 50983 / TXsc) TaxID=423536 RepID=C5KL46_PERM5|nr:conserved hypothetical protein [Perkinsus marinus ATCC 50983]EER14719.1 conserved hypothetical protein [Perkinsus marinus ATCC 50983]|eukprot:XP_002782923.1 conserved hypothetical protein [Perkinsus marinus ATCC 50983]
MPVHSSPPLAEPIVFTYEELKDPHSNLTDRILQAYGRDSLGLCCVSDVPKYTEYRQALLPKIHTLGNLPPSALEKYVLPEAFFNVGWSHGNEKLGGGRPDLGKGSFYANPLFENPGELDPTAQQRHPACATPNVWPKEVPGFREAFIDAGRLLAEVGTMVARHMDKACQAHGIKCCSLVEATFEKSRLCCGRALHYYPLEQGEVQEGTEDSWCGWHNDNSVITGLFSPMLLDATTGQPSTTPEDPKAGLYVQNRRREVYKVHLPPDCIAFQLGEAAQIMTGGHLVATPHMVKGSSVPEVSREQLAVFFEPDWDRVMALPDGNRTDQMVNAGANIPEVPPLAKRYRGPSVTFGEFLEDSFREYYNMKTSTAVAGGGTAAEMA